MDRVSIADLGAWCSVVGLDLVVRAYPAGDPLRDRAQLALLDRLRTVVHPSLGWQTEVPLPIEGDLRAWDAVVSGRAPAPWKIRVEAETSIRDVQALERRLRLKVRDDPGGAVILLAAETRANAQALRTHRPGLADLLPIPARALLSALREGRSPAGGGIIML